MTIDTETVKRVAELARINITDEELEFKEEFDASDEADDADLDLDLDDLEIL